MYHLSLFPCQPKVHCGLHPATLEEVVCPCWCGCDNIVSLLWFVADVLPWFFTTRSAQLATVKARGKLMTWFNLQPCNPLHPEPESGEKILDSLLTITVVALSLCPLRGCFATYRLELDQRKVKKVHIGRWVGGQELGRQCNQIMHSSIAYHIIFPTKINLNSVDSNN